MFSDLYLNSAIANVGGSRGSVAPGSTGTPSSTGNAQSIQQQNQKPQSRRRSSSREPSPWTHSKIDKQYDYFAADGTFRFQVVRFIPKDFRQRHKSPTGAWINRGVAPELRVLWNLPAIVAAASSNPSQPIFVCEGEKDAARLIASCGLLATTAPGGAATQNSQKKWLPQYTESLAGRIVIIVPDFNPPDPKTGRSPGREHAQYVANELTGTAAHVAILELPPTPAGPSRTNPPTIIDPSKKWDISDWLDAGGTQEQFTAALNCALANPFDPATFNAPSFEPDAPVEEDDDPHRLARLYLDKFRHEDGPCLRYWRESFYRWDGRSFHLIQHSEIKSELTASIKEEFDRLNLIELKNSLGDGDLPKALKVHNRLISDTLQALQSLCLLSGQIEQPAWLDETCRFVDPERNAHVRDFITMRNGILDIRRLLQSSQSSSQSDQTDQSPDQTDHPEPYLHPHTPRFFCPISIPYDFSLDAECPTWLRFVNHNLEGDEQRINILQEWFGYCLTFDTSQQKFLLMEGEGSNGKSVICSALMALLGLSNVCHVALEMWSKDFVLTQTIGRLANIVTEVGEIDKLAEGYLKSFTSGDRMTFNRKNKSLIEAQPTARLMLATNNRPRFSDKSNGIWRRMLMLPLNVQIQEHEKVKGMDKPEFWENLGGVPGGELPGMFRWALDGLDRLRQRGHFTESTISTRAIEEYRSENNSARSFLEKFFEPSVTGYIVTQDVYREYRLYCKENGYHPVANNMFGKAIRSIFKSASESQKTIPQMEGGIIKHRRPKCYDGVQRREDVDQIYQDQREQQESHSHGSLGSSYQQNSF